MNHRLTIAAAAATILASISEWVLILGGTWLIASIGAVIAVAIAGTVTRLAPPQAAISATVVAAIASVPLLADQSIYLKVAGLVIIACCAASATRVRVFRPVADLVTYCAVLLLYLNLILSATRSWVLLVPTARSLHHLVTLIHQGTALAKYPPPVTGGAGVVLLAAGSIGLAAIVVDIVAVRLRRPAIAGLPLLVIYMAPIATAAKTGGPSGILTFLIAATGYLALLASDGRNRLRGWGRVITVWHYAGEDDRLGGADIRGLAATGRRIGFAAVCAAIVAPLLLPTLNLHRLFDGNGGKATTVDAGLPNPVDQLHALLTSDSNLPVLSYRTNGKDAGEYLQVYVLNYHVTSGLWSIVNPKKTISIGSTALNPPPGLSPTVKVSPTTTNLKLDNVVGSSPGYAFPVFFLPVPYWPTEVSLDSSWSQADSTLMIFTGVGHHQGMSYTVTSDQAMPTAADEAASAATPVSRAIQKAYLPFPSKVSPQLANIALQITKNAKTPFAKAVALEQYFHTGKFTYSLKTINLPNTPQGLLTFLTKTRRGFCEQFAFAMAALARLVGIPSRIAIGYTPGTQEKSGGLWKVTTADAHAWPELYFPNLGWLRFEPTPGGPDGQGTAVQPSYALQNAIPPITPGGRSGKTKTNKAPKPGSSIITTHIKGPQPGDPGPLPPVQAKRAPLPVGQILLGVLAFLILAAAAPAVTRIVSRRRRWHGASGDAGLARAAWLEICADLADYGIGHRASESPRALAKRLYADEHIDTSARAAIGRIATVVERIRYAPEPTSAEGIRSDVTQVRRSLARSTGILNRLRARLFPASTIGPLLLTTRLTFGQLTGWVAAPDQPGSFTRSPRPALTPTRAS